LLFSTLGVKLDRQELSDGTENVQKECQIQFPIWHCFWIYKSLLGSNVMDHVSTPPPKWSEKVTLENILYWGATTIYFDRAGGGPCEAI
jgi:hypothetical protein